MLQPPGQRDVDTDGILAYLNKGDKFGIVGHAMRPGFRKFMVRLEYEHFSPHGDNNDKFQFVLVNFMEMNDWLLIIIPAANRADAEKIAAECDLRFADGVPTCFGGEKGKEQFPIQHKDVWSAENLPGSDVYKGKSAEILEAETQWVENFFAMQEAFLRGQIPEWAKSLPLAFPDSTDVPIGVVVDTEHGKAVALGSEPECKGFARIANANREAAGHEPCFVAMDWKTCAREGVKG
jgi:hypothetical protein